MTKHHIDDEGNVRRCQARVKPCKYSLHGDSAEEARSKFEATMNAAATPDAATSEGDFLQNLTYRNVRKMPALFLMDYSTHTMTQTLNPAAEWIFEETSRPTRKRDGTSITVTEDGLVWARRSVKAGKTRPPGYIEAELDPVTGHSFGLEPIEQSSFSKMLKRARGEATLPPGTYELCGPKINGNPEKLSEPTLMPHGEDVATEIPPMTDVPRDQAYERLKVVFAGYRDAGIEGVVWHGSGGKRAKLRVKDFFGDGR